MEAKIHKPLSTIGDAADLQIRWLKKLKTTPEKYYMYMYTYTYMYMYMYVRMYVCTYVRMYVLYDCTTVRTVRRYVGT